jgi:nucleoside-diphosphate-sugar epimerase
VRILIVGGTSFIAGHLIARLAARDLEVSATCRESRG